MLLQEKKMFSEIVDILGAMETKIMVILKLIKLLNRNMLQQLQVFLKQQEQDLHLEQQKVS